MLGDKGLRCWRIGGGGRRGLGRVVYWVERNLDGQERDVVLGLLVGKCSWLCPVGRVLEAVFLGQCC